MKTDTPTWKVIDKGSMNNNKQYYLVLGMMLLALLLYSWAYQFIWHWLTYDLSDGRWILSMIDPASSSKTIDPDMRLIGIEGRFIWAASLLFLLLAIFGMVLASIYTVLNSISRWRVIVGVVSLLLLAGMGIVFGIPIEADYQSYMGLIHAGDGSGFQQDAAQPFQFSRYLLLIFQPYYSQATLNIFSVIEQWLPALVFIANVFLIIALLVLTLIAIQATPDSNSLARRFVHFRLLLLMGSALFTAIALYYLSQYSWFAQVLSATHSDGASLLRELQRGVTLFLGTSNSLSLLLLFLPPGWILTHQARALYQNEISTLSETAPSESTWLANTRLTLFSGPAMKIVIITAPLLVSGALMLTEKALMGT
jgi:hypothetical protein